MTAVERDELAAWLRISGFKDIGAVPGGCWGRGPVLVTIFPQTTFLSVFDGPDPYKDKLLWSTQYNDAPTSVIAHGVSTALNHAIGVTLT